MTSPNYNDFNIYTGAPLSNTQWNFNLNKIISYLTAGAFDFALRSWSANANCSMGNANINNLADPVNLQDAATMNYVKNNSIPPGTLAGLQISNDPTTPATILDIAPGAVTDSTEEKPIFLTSSFTKNLAAAWQQGTGNGGLDTGTVTAGNTYHVFAILNANTNTSDVLFSLSASNPLMPTGYTYFQRIGSIVYTNGSVIQPFVQVGNQFLWKTPTQDLSNLTSATTPAITSSARTLYTLNVPTGIPVVPIIQATFSSNTEGGGSPASIFGIFTSPLVNDVAPTSALYDVYTAQNQTFLFLANFSGNIVTNNSAQIGFRASQQSEAGLNLITKGYIDLTRSNR